MHFTFLCEICCIYLNVGVMQILETNANLKCSFLFYPTATRRTGSFNQGIYSENDYLISLNVCLFIHKNKHVFVKLQIYTLVPFEYTGWPRKNATTLIINFKDIIHKTELIFLFFYYVENSFPNKTTP